MKSFRKQRTRKQRKRKQRTRKQRTMKQRGGAHFMVGVVLDNKSQEYLKSEKFDHPGFQVYNSCHHVTIRFGQGFLPEDPSVGTSVKIVCDQAGLNLKAKALKVASITTLTNEPITFVEDATNNEMLHITVRHLGSVDAKESNKITEWIPLSTPVVLYGKVSLATDFRWNPNDFNDIKY